MLSAVAQRAPDGTSFARTGPVELGQAFLKTGTSAAEAVNRLTLDGQVWLVADARIDGRRELIEKLRRRGCTVQESAPHAELILHAYEAFGDGFLDHLLGDFAFSLWDDRRQRLICARDRLGVRPFYFAEMPDEFAFASDIHALLALGHIPQELDEVAIADFLLIGTCLDADRTIYRSVRALPPATRLDVVEGKILESKYWQPSWTQEIRFKSIGDYAERFNELFEQAVNDRFPEGPFAVSLSGGMDSTAIAAVAARHSSSAISAYHVSARSIEPTDDEERYAELVAKHLGLRFVSQDLGNYLLFARREERAMQTAFPSPAPHLSAHRDVLFDMERHSERVLFNGYQGDAVFLPSPHYHSDLLRSGRWIKFSREALRHVVAARSARGMALRTAWRRSIAPPAWKPPMPDWIEAGMAARVHLESRWERWWGDHQGATDTASQLQLSVAHRHFELAEALPSPVVMRYPFLDTRLIEFVTALPNFMRANKLVLREAMRGKLPEAVRTRPKIAAAGDVLRKLVTNGKIDLSDREYVSPFLNEAAYCEAWKEYCKGKGQDSTWASWLIVQPIALEKWLKQMQECKQ